MKSHAVPAALFFLAALFNSPAANADSRYSVINKISVPGDSGWDYLTADNDLRRLFISHGSKVDAIDLDTLHVAGTIYGTPLPHCVVVAGATGKAFVTQGRTDSVTIFNPRTLKKTGEIPTDAGPDAAAFDPTSSHVFVFNGKKNTATVIDVQKDDSIGTVKLPGRPEFGVADGSGRVYVDIQDKDSVTEIDSRSLKVTNTYPLAGCSAPSTLALDRSHRRLFIGCENRAMVVVDPDSGRVIAKLPIGERVDSTAYDAELGLIFNSAVDGTLTIIKQESADKYSVSENVRTELGARTMALDPKTHRVFLVTAKFGPPPPPTPEKPNPKSTIVPGSFTLLIVGKQ